MKNKLSFYLQKSHRIKIDNFSALFPKISILLKKKELFVDGTVGVNTCFLDSTPNIILFSDAKNKTATLALETLTEKEAMSLTDLIKKSE